MSEMKLELVPVPTTDIDSAKAFYIENVGFSLDHDVTPAKGVRVVQLTPPGSGARSCWAVGYLEAKCHRAFCAGCTSWSRTSTLLAQRCRPEDWRPLRSRIWAEFFSQASLIPAATPGFCSRSVLASGH